VPAANYGFYHQNGTFTSGTNHAVGYYTGTPPGELRNFFVFDLTGLAGNITGATLRAFNPSTGFSSPQGTETFTLFDVSTSLDTLTTLAGGTAAFADLGTGAPLGSVTVTSTVANTVVEVTLNAQGIAYLNSVNGRIALGGALTTLAYGALSERLFNSATGAIVRELVVTTNDNPIPCAYSLSQTSLTIPAEGGNASVNLINSAGANCQWSVTNSAGWITLGTSNGTGSATVGFSAAANPSATQRSTTLTIAGRSLTVIQEAAAPVTPIITAQRFVSLTPCRLVETRQEYNFEGRTPPFGPPFLNGGETRTFTPSASNVCNVPASAKSYVLNVTLVPRGGGVDFATLYPAAEARPDFWTVRSPDGLIVANSAIVRAGTGGALSLYASTTTDVLGDIAGYFTDNPAESNLVYYPLTPCRVIETRALYRPQPGPFGPPSLPRQTTRSFRFPDNPYCVIPNGAAAYSVTLTVVPPAALPFLTAWPSSGPQPNVSSINSPNGRVLANSIIVPASGDGSINLYAFESTDVIVDINGYFAPDNGTTGLFYYPVTQCRLSNTMDGSLTGSFGGPIFEDQTARSIPIPASTRCSGIPTTAKAYALNATVVPNGNAMPYLTVWPTGQPQPIASVINAFEGQTVSSGFIVPAGTGGSIDVFAYRRTQVALEISGYFGR
jgi:hypothetical protein